ncbi:MAG: hypothetical protein ACHQZR_02220 [Candidatus Limnocylindrales bacterium]
MTNQVIRPVRLAACLVTATVLLAACGASAGAGQVGDAGPDAAGLTVPTWPATATPGWSLLPDGPSASPGVTVQPTGPAAAASGGATGSSSSSTYGGLSAATLAQLEQLLLQGNQALDAANAAASDDAAQSGQDEGALP